jgi:hypothetical protein
LIDRKGSGEMKDLNLVVMFRLSGEGDMRVKGASRIKLDGRGGLMVFSENGTAETYALQNVQSFSIQPMKSVSYLPAA